MLVALQKQDDYFQKKKPCKTHKKIAKKEGDIVGVLCKKCGFPLIKKVTKTPIGILAPSIEGIVIRGRFKAKVKRH